MPSPSPVAIVTGGASGIGLAITTHLLTQHYRVCIADYNPSGAAIASSLNSTHGSNSVLFIQTDVADYKQQQSLFAKAFVWGDRRLDFLAANAGIDDRMSLYEGNEGMETEKIRFTSADAGGEDDGKGEGEETEVEVPLPLNLQTIRVDLDAVFQGIWLFKYFNRISVKSPGEEKGGRVVVTSSSAGLYPIPTNPQYGASKHALLGLIRSAAPPLLHLDNITLNAILPAFVLTNLCPAFIRDSFPAEHVTPMETVIRAVSCFLDDEVKDGIAVKDGVRVDASVVLEERGKAKGRLTGQAVECSLGEMFFRLQPGWANESQRWMGEGADGFWERAYRDNVKGVEMEGGVGH